MDSGSASGSGAAPRTTARSGTWALVPIKAFDEAKTRLAAVLTAQQRRELAQAMAARVIGQLQLEKGLLGIAVVTGDHDVAAFSHLLGACVIFEGPSGSLTRAVSDGVKLLFAEGATAVLVIHADIPLIRPDDISALLSCREDAAVTIVPSRDGGTNALLLNADCPLLFAFGPDSARLHCDRAQAIGLSVQMRHLPSIAFDVDTPANLLDLAAHDLEPPIRAAIGSLVVPKKRAPPPR